MDKDKELRNEAEGQAEAGMGAGRGTTFEGQNEETTTTLHHPNNHNGDDINTSTTPTNASKDLLRNYSSPTLSNTTLKNDDEHYLPPQDGTSPPTDTTASASAIPQSEPEATRTTLQTFIIMASLCASVFLAALDTTIVTTALPTISNYFQSNAGYTWIGSAYLLANAASVPSWGKFSDIWGRKPILLVAAAIFFIGSLLAAVAVNIGMLIAARAIQGIGGGGLIILVNICISDLFSMRNRGTYFGMIGMVWALASAIGPVLGGVFTEKVSWRWCFYINLPITGLVFVLLYFFLHLDNPKTPVWEGLKAVDWAGSLLVVGATLMLLLGLEFGGVIHPWGSAIVICLIVFGIVVGVLFVLNEWKLARYPVMPLRLFKHASNIASLGVCFCHGYVFIAGTYYLPLYFQAVLGASPLLSGVYLLPFALSLSLVSGATGVFIKKTGKYLPPIWFGLIIMVLGFGLFIDLPFERNWSKIILYQVVAGIGVGPNFQSPLIALQTMISKRDVATATSTFGFMRNLSTSISVVIGGVVFQNEMQTRQAGLNTSLGPSLALALSGGSAGSSVGIVNDLLPAQRDIARRAYWESLRIMWIQYVAFAVLGLLVSAFIGKQVLSEEHEVTKTGLKEEESKRLEEKERRKASRDALRAGKKSGSEERVGKEEV